MARLFDMARMTVSGTPSTGTITLGSAVDGFQTFSAAGVTDGLIVSYSIKDGSDWEVGRGTYTASGTTLTRGPLFSSNSNAAVDLTSAAIVWIAILCEDLIQTITLTGNTAGSTSPIISPDLELAGGQNITLSGTSNTISIIGATSATAQNRFANGNSFGQSSSAVGTLTSLGVSATGGISAGFSTDASSAVLMLSVAPPVASGAVGNYFVSGNTTAISSSSTHTLTNMSVSGAGIVSVGVSTTGAGAGILVVSASTAATNPLLSVFAVGNTTSSVSSGVNAAGSLSFDGAGIVSVGVSNSSVVISASTAATNPLFSVFAVGNTTSSVSSGVIAAGSLSFDGAGIVSVGISNSSVVISAPSPAASGTVGNYFASGNTTALSSSSTHTLSNVSVSGAGIVSVGVSTTGAGAGILVVSASTAATNPLLSLFAVGNTTSSVSSGVNAAGSISFDGAGIISVGISNSSVVLSAPAPNLSLFAVGNTTVSSSTSSVLPEALSFSGAGVASVGYSSNTIIISAPAAANALVSLFAVGNTTSSVSSGVQGVNSLSFDGAGIVSVGISNSSIVISASTAATNPLLSIFAVGNTTSSVSSGLIAAGSMSFDAAGALSVGISNSSVVISSPPVSTLTGVSGITLSTAGSTISIGMDVVSFLEPREWQGTATSTWPLGTMALGAFAIYNPLAINQVNFFSSRAVAAPLMTLSSSSASRTVTASATWGSTASLVIYSQQDATVFGTFSSTTASFGMSAALSASYSSSSKTGSQTVTFGWPQGTSAAVTSSMSTTFSTVSASLATQVMHTSSSLFSGFLRNDYPFLATFPPGGEYLVGIMWSTASGSSTLSSGLVTMSAPTWLASNGILTQGPAGAIGVPGATTFNPFPGVGSISSAGSAVPATLAWNSLSTAVSHPVNYFFLNSG